MAFGVELPANLGEAPSAPGTEAAPSGSDQFSSKAPGTESSEGATKEAPLTDLDKLERFRFEGREWKREDLRRAYLRQQDYTRKTQELAETRKYTDNFAIDLREVINNRARLEDFRRIYPREFVERAEEILGHLPEQKPAQGTSQQQGQDPVRSELEGIKRDLGQWKQEKQQAEVASIQSWLDNKFDAFTKKYSNVSRFGEGDKNPVLKAINSDLTILAEKGTKITEQVIEHYFKGYDDTLKASWNAMRKSEITQQQRAGKEARDVGPGGGAPGAAPKGPKTFKEATALMIADLEAKGARR